MIESGVHKNRSRVTSLGTYYSGQKEKTSFSSSVIKFKRGVESVIDLFCNDAVASVSANDTNYDYIVRALGKTESVPDCGRPLDYLGCALQSASIGFYAPELIRKTRTVSSVRALPFNLRARAVVNAYSFDVTLIELSNPRFLIIDDVYASGSTASAISSAITLSLPCARVDVFTLASSTIK